MTDLVIRDCKASRYMGPRGQQDGHEITLVLTDVDEVMAILRRDQPAAEPKPEVAA